MRISTEKMVSYLPFDDGGNRAYDYSPVRTTDTDGVLGTGCTYTDDAVMGQALRMIDNDGETANCECGSVPLDLTDEWTISAYIKTTGTQIDFLVNYSGAGQYLEHAQSVRTGEWVFVALQRYFKNGYHVRVVVEGSIVYDEQCLGRPVGIGISDNLAGRQDVTIDEFKAWNRALSLVELIKMQRNDEDVEYYINGKNFKDFGVEVAKSDGLVSGLRRKDPLRLDYPDYHGEVLSLSRPRYEAREISLECFIVANSNVSFVMMMNRFIDEFHFKDGVQRMEVVYGDSARPLVYDVYMNESIDVDKTWNQKIMVGTFTLTLVEPSPVKRILRHVCQSAGYSTFQITTNKKIDVSWGDGDTHCEYSTNGTNWEQRDKSSNIRGTQIYVRHHYSEAGEYNIAIHGVIEDITFFNTDDIIAWTRL